MRRSISFGLIAAIVTTLSAAAQQRIAGGRPLHNEAERAARWKPVALPFQSAGLARFKLKGDGAATPFFKGEVYHMFDFDHTGAEQVVTLDGDTLRVYGNANVVPRSVTRDGEYRRVNSNHTHY